MVTTKSAKTTRRPGLIKHQTAFDQAGKEFELPTFLEAQVVNIADETIQTITFSNFEIISKEIDKLFYSIKQSVYNNKIDIDNFRNMVFSGMRLFPGEDETILVLSIIGLYQLIRINNAYEFNLIFYLYVLNSLL